MNETKLTICQEAFKLFLQKNFKEVTMNEILEKSGLSRGTFYYYFKSKEQLYEEVIQMYCVTVPTTVQRKISEDSLYEFYHDYLDNASKAYAVLGEKIRDAQVDVFNFFALTLDAMKRLPRFREIMKVVNAEVLKIWIRVIRSAREKGEISSVMTDEKIAWFFKLTMEGMGMLSQLEGWPSAQNDAELLALWDKFYEQIKK